MDTRSPSTGLAGSLLERLTTPHRPGALLQALHPRWGTRLPGARLQGTIAEIRPTGVDAAAVRIRAPKRVGRHVPGQFTTLAVDVDGVRQHRSFTLTSLPAPTDGVIEVTVQSDPSGTVSPHLVHRARPGDVVGLSEPAGDFVLPTVSSIGDLPPLLMVSGGSGITPFLAMLRWLSTQQMSTARTAAAPRGMQPPVDDRRPDVALLHHVTSVDAVLHGSEIEALAAVFPWLRIELVVTRGTDGRPLPGTHLDAGRLDELCADWRDRLAYVCGPVGLLEFAHRHWSESGLADRLLTESFQPALPVAARRAGDPGASFTASFSASDGGTAVANGTTPLLEVAEATGLAPASGCRMGICHTCSTRLCAGTTRDLRDGRISMAGDHVQICVNAAASDVVLDL